MLRYHGLRRGAEIRSVLMEKCRGQMKNSLSDERRENQSVECAKEFVGFNGRQCLAIGQ